MDKLANQFPWSNVNSSCLLRNYTIRHPTWLKIVINMIFISVFDQPGSLSLSRARVKYKCALVWYLFQLIKIGHIQVHGWCTLDTFIEKWQQQNSKFRIYVNAITKCPSFCTISTMRVLVLIFSYLGAEMYTRRYNNVNWFCLYNRRNRRNNSTGNGSVYVLLTFVTVCHLLCFIINVFRWTMRPKMKLYIQLEWQEISTQKTRFFFFFESTTTNECNYNGHGQPHCLTKMCNYIYSQETASILCSHAFHLPINKENKCPHKKLLMNASTDSIQWLNIFSAFYSF